MNTASDRASATRRRILDVAARQFRALGYAGVGLRSIAAGAGMKAGSLYYHFDSKEDIVAEVLEIGIDLVHDAVAEAVRSMEGAQSAETVLRTAITRHLYAFFKWSDYTSANVRIFGQVPEGIRAANLPARRRYEKLWDEILERLRREGLAREGIDVHATRSFLLGAMNATPEWFDSDRGDIDTLAEKYADIVLHGIVKQDGPGDERTA